MLQGKGDGLCGRILTLNRKEEREEKGADRKVHASTNQQNGADRVKMGPQRQTKGRKKIQQGEGKLALCLHREGHRRTRKKRSPILNNRSEIDEKDIIGGELHVKTVRTVESSICRPRALGT